MCNRYVKSMIHTAVLCMGVAAMFVAFERVANADCGCTPIVCAGKASVQDGATCACVIPTIACELPVTCPSGQGFDQLTCACAVCSGGGLPTCEQDAINAYTAAVTAIPATDVCEETKKAVHTDNEALHKALEACEHQMCSKEKAAGGED